MNSNYKHVIAAYGSLREGQYNNLAFKSHFGKDALTLLDKGKLSGYLMYDLGMYPGILKDTSNETIVVDYLECKTEEIFNIIEDMELNSGYRSETFVSKKLDCNVTIYIYDDEKIAERTFLVPEGDWVKYKLNALEINEDSLTYD